ncbi:acyclic terpene utilization AtuA family protein [Cupriavidus sp. D384]|uniref:acyclic terpene utilization AtuA family protein n=1 Tax=Cupriavidus sp. D384 TaxID=1538095 RepID=UPI0008351546|nr:acyclic terpene utilization AtuA family protein [Cupriavidus sp. D384]
MVKSLLVGCGAGFSGDRVDAAEPVVDTLIRRAQPAVLIYENLAERTLAFAHIAKSNDPQLGYEPLLALELSPVLGKCLSHGIPIVGNFGAANPEGAAKRILELAAELGLPTPTIAIVSGDEVPLDGHIEAMATLFATSVPQEKVVSANVYQGAFPIAEALKAGAQIVVTGRVADPALTLGPAIAHFGWQEDDWDKLAGASIAGHLLECGSQVTGGYFCDPGMKDVPGMDKLGFPIAEIFPDGSCIITKADDTGGMVDLLTVKEQLIYEIHDPARFMTPDVVADIGELELEQIGANAVRVHGVRGQQRPDTLKTNVYFDDGWLGEAEISYSGCNAEARARLSMQVIEARLKGALHLRFDLIGVVSISGDDSGRLLKSTARGFASDVRLRVAGAHAEADVIDRMLREVNALYNNGPAGGGGVRLNKRRRVSMQTCFVPRSAVPARFHFVTQ